MAADRGAFIDQSQSLNVHIAAPSFSKLTSMHFYAWKQGLKTGMYYLRTRPAANPIQFTMDKEKATASMRKSSTTDKELTKEDEEEAIKKLNEAAMLCSLENPGECLMCSG